jgi:phosphoenolpyruvate synthase/pyruvate phosphate dikinase
LPERLQKKLSPGLIAARLKTENLFNAVDLALRKYTELIAKKTGYPLALADFLTIDEMENYLKNNKLPSKKELTSRSKGLAFFCAGKNVKLLTGSSYKDLQKYLVSFSGNELKGAIAYKGLAKGKARIVLDPFKVKKFDKGDVLITGMTRPEFLSLMKKASAFVTDAGGLLSHAAIVARELKKPCILATENASKVIKDGDLVEVDANKGIVRILKRA